MWKKKGIGILKKIYPEIKIISGLPIDQFRKKLKLIDIFIALSVRDSKGNLDDASVVILEAMAAGCAVIATDLPGNKTLIKNGTDGFLVNPYNLNEVQIKVNRLKRSIKLRRRLGKNAQQTIQRLFTPEKIAGQYLRLF